MRLTPPEQENGVLANLIIAGAGRSGTTSLFRYLADHPSVCASSAKEVHFFDNIPSEGLSQESLKHYASFFCHCGSFIPIRMEATAGYLYGGKRTAEAIRNVMPEVKLIFTLREPVSRAFTVFRKSKTGEPETFADLSFDDFVTIGTDGEHADSKGELHDRSEKISARLLQGCYARFLKQYFAVFPSEQICVLFFDDFAKDARSVMSRVSDFLGIDRNFYYSYRFHVENKTRYYRFARLHRFASRANVKLENSLNRYPKVRRALRGVYNVVNERKHDQGEISEFARRKLEQFYQPDNRDLYALLKQHVPHVRLPEWVARTSAV